MTTQRKFKISINEQMINKPEPWEIGSNQNHFELLSVTQKEFIDLVCKKGYAFAPGIFKDNVRKKQHFQGAEVAVLDIDDGNLKEDLLDPKLKEYEALLYTTPSHGKDGKDKYRLVFFLPHLIEDTQEYELLIQGLLKEFPKADLQCKDASRMFFGSQDCIYVNCGGNN